MIRLHTVMQAAAVLDVNGALRLINAVNSCECFCPSRDHMHLCRTPCHGRVYDALPPESRIANARLLQPKDPQQRKACVLHLAGTGDHTWHRRLNLGGPLLQQVCLPSCCVVFHV